MRRERPGLGREVDRMGTQVTIMGGANGRRELEWGKDVMER